MQIRCVVVVVDQPGVVVGVRVLAGERRIVRVVVMVVVVAVGGVGVGRLRGGGRGAVGGGEGGRGRGERNSPPGGDRRPRGDRPAGERAAAGCDGDRGAEERCDGEHR